jgi:hypothetical protein
VILCSEVIPDDFSIRRLLNGLTAATAPFARSTAMEMLSSAIVSSDPRFRDKLLSTRMICGGAVSTIAPNAAILSSIVSIVFCRGEHRSTVIIRGGAISHHDPTPVAPLPILLSTLPATVLLNLNRSPQIVTNTKPTPKKLNKKML